MTIPRNTPTINFIARVSGEAIKKEISGESSMGVLLPKVTTTKSTRISINKTSTKRNLCSRKTMINIPRKKKTILMTQILLNTKRNTKIKIIQKIPITAKFSIKKNTSKMKGNMEMNNTHIQRSGRIRNLNIKKSNTMSKDLVIWIRKLQLLKY